MQRKIIFLKWVDPLAHLVVDETTPEEQEAIDTFLEEGEVKTDPHGEEMAKVGPGILIPAGIIPLRESNIPSRIFNFWMGHTNFGITDSVTEAIAEVPGVETLDIQTRYRFRFSVGKAFAKDEVKKAINAATGCSPAKKLTKMEAIQAQLKKRYPYWAVLVLSNGRLDVVGGASRDEVETKVKGRAREEVVYSW